MPTETPPQVDADRARAVWAKYVESHDISSLIGKTAAIEPVSGRIWFGESAKDVWEKMATDGIRAPAYCLRVGRNFYVRKGGHR